MWGTGRRHIARKNTRRFIPACVGNRRKERAYTTRQPVHPRVCGEQLLHPPHCVIQIGSSPRVWGTVADLPAQLAPRRFIPACVGNRDFANDKGECWPVHPRVCGEQNNLLLANLPIAGSSPRVWGTDDGLILDWMDARFIPACVGNSAAMVSFDCRGAVHPRVCGEQSCAMRYRCCQAGSSPRVWGTGIMCNFWPMEKRFIPACVGNSVCGFGTSAACAVHPRVCGEQCMMCWPAP